MLTRTFLLTFLLLSGINNFAQWLEPGEVAPDFTATDLDGNTWHLQEILDSGKSVLLMFGSAENSTVGDMMTNNTLLTNYNTYGPNGSDDVVMLFIESNPNNLTSDIYGPPGTGVTDLAAISPCPIIDGDQTLLDNYTSNIAWGTDYHEYFVVICSVGIVRDYYQLTQPSFAFTDATDDCGDMYPGYDLYVFLTGNTSYCDQSALNLGFVNTGTVPSEAATASLEVNGTYYYYDIPAGLLPMEFYYITLTDFILEGIQLGTLTLTSPDGNPANNTSSHNILSAFETSTHLKLHFTAPSGGNFHLHGTFPYAPPNAWDLYSPAGNVTEYVQNIYFNEIGCQWFTYDIYSVTNDYALDVYSIAADGAETLLTTITSSYPWPDQNFSGLLLKFNATEFVAPMISGYVFNDLNANAVQDAGEPGIGNIAVQYGGQTFYTDNNGMYYLNLNAGYNGAIQIVYDNSIWQSTSTGTSVSTATNFVGSANFGLINASPNYDLNADISLPPLVCSQSGELDVMINNSGNSICDATITITTDPSINITSAIPSPTSISGNIMIWNMDQMNAGASELLKLFILSPDYNLMGSPILTSVELVTMTESGIVMNTENISETEILLCAWDPNQITATPAGAGTGNIIDPGTEIEYLIEFQNTGNAPATDIVVSNMLDSDLDYSTFEWIGASHVCHPVVNLNDGQLNFEFPEIMLPDSTNDEPNSHGWLRYKVHAKSTLTPGTAIDNTAYIYFDQNPAVVTNTYTHHITTVSVDESSIDQFMIYPNPAQDEIFILNAGNDAIELTIHNAQNALMKKQNIRNKTQSVQIGELPSGIYFITMTEANGKKHFTRLVKN